MSTHPIQWHTPLPLWARIGTSADAAIAGPDQFRPALLRFASDDFMEQMIALLARDPSRLGQLLARPETWRSPAAGSDDARAGLMEQVPLPRRVESLLRSRSPTRAKALVEPVASSRALTEKTQARKLPLKLYQPAHQRHYLVSASLVCGVAGLPERRVVPGGSEQVGFVLRRLLPITGASGDASETEFAFIKGGNAARWQRVTNEASATVLAPGEEMLPLFPLRFQDELAHPRTLWTGLVPVARREDYLGANIERGVVPLLQGQRDALVAPAPASPAPSVSRRLMQFKMEVAEPWKSLVRSACKAKLSLDESSPPGMSGGSESPDQRKARLLRLNAQWQMQSWLILLDFADYLAAYLPKLSNAIDNPAAAGTLSGAEHTLYEWLGVSTLSTDLTEAMPTGTAPHLKTPAASLRDALRKVRVPAVREGLEGATTLYAPNSSRADWPDFHFLLAGLDIKLRLAGAWSALGSLGVAVPTDEVIDRPDAVVVGDLVPGQAEAQLLDRLTAAVVLALVPGQEADAPPLPHTVQLCKTLANTADDAGWFVVRCVYLNRDCVPLHAPVTSEPSQRFQLANFFDSDAPARPIRITLPIDTTPAGLRKHSKNTAFVISDVLCGQIQRAKGLGFIDLVRSVLPWPLHKDLDMAEGGACGGGVNIGMICSLSIPIITICALILLIIIVTLLDAIFHWLPYLIFCLPVLRLSGKKKDVP